MGKNYLRAGLTAAVMTLGTGGAAVSCGAPQDQGNPAAVTGDDVGTEGEALSKCNGGANGAADYCSATCTCVAGEGDCDADSNCSGGAVCCRAKGTQFGFSENIDVCAPAHCRDKVLDGDETSPDCGGSCGTHCGANPCASLPANGQVGHCTTACPCPALQGGCTSTACQAGLVCTKRVGADFGFAQTLNMCLASTCTNGMMDGDETGVDCGGSCLPCSGGSVSAKAYGGPNNDLIESAAYDKSGNLYIAGRTSSASINFGTGALASHGNSDVFLAKFDASGKNLWSKRIGGTGADGDAGVAVAVDTANNVVITGNFYTSVDFGGGAITVNGTSDVFLAKYDSAGTFQWVKHFGGTRGNRGLGIVTDSTKAIIITGGFEDSISFGGPTFTAVSANNGKLTDMFVAKFLTSGNYVWSKAFGSADNDEGEAVTVDASNNVYVAGLFSDSIDFGTGSQTSAGGSDAVGIKFTSAGATSWVKHWGGTSTDRAGAVASAPNGDVVFGGQFRGSADFGGGSVSAGGGVNGFLVSVAAADGSYAWSNTYTGTGTSQVLGLKANSSSKLAAVGGFQGSVDFGSGSKTSAGANDVFVIFYDGTGAKQFEAEYGGSGGDIANEVALTTGVASVGGQFASSPFVIEGTSLSNAGGIDGFLARFSF